MICTPIGKPDGDRAIGTAVAGRPQVLLMLERLIEYMAGHPGVSFDTCENVARDFRARFPFATHRGYPFDQDYP